MRKYILLVSAFLLSTGAFAQDKIAQAIYDPYEDAAHEIDNALKMAKAIGRHVFIQVGGNWCGPCLRFHHFITSDEEINSLVNANYVVYHLNYSKENQNQALLEKYGNPQRLNFPVFLILDEEGRLLHTQRVNDLVNNMGYDRKKLIAFFKKWRPGNEQ